MDCTDLKKRAQGGDGRTKRGKKERGDIIGWSDGRMDGWTERTTVSSVRPSVKSFLAYKIHSGSPRRREGNKGRRYGRRWRRGCGRGTGTGTGTGGNRDTDVDRDVMSMWMRMYTRNRIAGMWLWLWLWRTYPTLPYLTYNKAKKKRKIYESQERRDI